MTLYRLFLALLSLISVAACKSVSSGVASQNATDSTVMAQGSDPQNDNLVRIMRIKESKDRLMSLFDEDRGLWTEAEWWQQPNILETLAEYERQFPGEQPKFAWVADKMFTKNNKNEFINEFFDDTGWWGLGWIRAYEVTREPRYLAASQKIFDYLAREGWVESTCKGGMRWKTDDGVKNAITTEVFMRLALRLYLNTPASDAGRRDFYRKWSLKAWNWFNQSGLRLESTNQITDKLDMARCQNLDRAAFTYNQGVILGALADLYTISGRDGRYLDLAHKIAMANWQHNSQSNILVEFGGDEKAGLDGALFKGIFMRNLNYLLLQTPDQRKHQYRAYLTASAAGAWHNKNLASYFTDSWSRPFGGDAMRARSQASGLDALLAAPVFADGPYVPDVCFYEKWGFMGRSNCYAVPDNGIGYRDFYDQSLNDKVTSLRVFPHACLTVWEHWNEDPSQRGKVLTFNGGATGKAEWLLEEVGMNDMITSFEARRCR